VTLAVVVGSEHRPHGAVRLDTYGCSLIEADAGAQRASKTRRGDARGLDIAGHADPAQPPAPLGLDAALLESLVVGERERARKNFREIAAVIGWADRRLVWHRARRNEIAPADFRAIESKPLGRSVGKPLQHVTGLGPPRAAKRIGRRGVGEHAGHFHEDRSGAIAPRQERAVDRARNGGTECRNICAEIGQGLDLQRQEPAVRVERELGVGQVIAALIVGNKTFRPRRYPSYGMTQPSRGPGDDPLLRIEFALVAEAAAHVG
jgi:hypothetical protein